MRGHSDRISGAIPCNKEPALAVELAERDEQDQQGQPRPGEPERETADLLAQLWGTDPHETAFFLAECSLTRLARIESHARHTSSVGSASGDVAWR